jgi:hypothetical protein
MIPEEIVEATWREVGKYSPDKAVNEMIALGKKQPDLLGFITEYTKDLNKDVKELSIYMFFTIFRMFKKSSDRRIKPVMMKKILAVFDEKKKLLGKLGSVHEKMFQRIAEEQFTEQPYVLKYIVETLFEENEDGGELDEESVGSLFLLMITIVEVLDFYFN